MASNTQPGECPHCGQEFDHLPSHKWQCPEKPKEQENDDDDGGDQENVDQDSASDEPTESASESIDNQSPENQESSDSGIEVDQVDPEEKDTRKNKESTSNTQGDDGDKWVEINYNSGKQVKCIIKTTDIQEPKKAQKLLKAFKTGDADDIPQFDEIRLSDGELR